MKLKQLYNEIKMIPPNRILLKKDSNWDNDNCYFEAKGERFAVLDYELRHPGYVLEREFYNSIRKYIFIDFLKSKNIPYRISDDNPNIIYVENKYFIAPDKINEIKLIKGPLSIFNSLVIGKYYLMEDKSIEKNPPQRTIFLMNKYREFDNEGNEVLVIDYKISEASMSKIYTRKTYSDLKKYNKNLIKIDKKMYVNCSKTFLTITPRN